MRKIWKNIPVVVIAAFSLVACAGEESPKVASIQKKDKNLSCSEVMLEINEAEFYRKTANTNKKPGINTVLMPIGYISTYVDAEEAVNAADARVDYLNRIYDILKCDDPQSPANHYASRGYPPYSDYGAMSGGSSPARFEGPGFGQGNSYPHAYPAPRSYSYNTTGAYYGEDWYW